MSINTITSYVLRTTREVTPETLKRITKVQIFEGAQSVYREVNREVMVAERKYEDEVERRQELAKQADELREQLAFVRQSLEETHSREVHLRGIVEGMRGAPSILSPEPSNEYGGRFSSIHSNFIGGKL
jgi:hypothetical protein